MTHSHEAGNLNRIIGWLTILSALVIAIGFATVDALMEDDNYHSVWLAYSLIPLIMGMTIVCYKVPINSSGKLIVIAVGTFGMLLIAMGIALLAVMSVLESSLYDTLRTRIDGIIVRPADALAYRSVFAIPITLVGLMFFIPTRRIWDAQ